MNTMDNETFLRFGKNFQEKLCQLMLEDRPFFDQIMEVLDQLQEQIQYSPKFRSDDVSVANRTQPS